MIRLDNIQAEDLIEYLPSYISAAEELVRITKVADCHLEDLTFVREVLLSKDFYFAIPTSKEAFTLYDLGHILDGRWSNNNLSKLNYNDSDMMERIRSERQGLLLSTYRPGTTFVLHGVVNEKIIRKIISFSRKV